MNRLDRISALLVQLQSRSVVRAADMAERFGVSLRTIYRDIRTLSEAGVPVCGDAGVGYSLVEGYRLPPLMFTREEAMAFLTAEKFIEQMTDSHNSLHFHQGMDKVRAVMRGVDKNYMSDLSGSISVYRSRHTPGQKTPNLLQTILGSVNDRKILEMDYTDADGRVSRREVEAVGITFSHPIWYLTAWCHLRGEYRTFRLDRIDNIALTKRPHTIAEHPPLESLIGHDDYACLTEVVIHTTAEVARRNADASYFMGLAGQRELDYGRVEQTYMCYGTETIARWALANADTTSVVSPPEVKNRIKEIIKNIAMKINSVEIKELEPIHTIAIEHVGEYSGIAAAFERLGAWATEKGYWVKGPRMAGVYHDDPSRVAVGQLRSKACLEDMGGMEPAEGMVRYTISGGKYFMMNAEVKMAEYGEAWQKAYAACAEQGLECDTRDHYELYISCTDHTQGENALWIVEFRIPVK